MPVRGRAAVAVLLLLLPGLVPPAAGQPQPPLGGLLVEPTQVPVDLFYDGTTLEAAALVPSGYEAVIRLTSGTQRLEMKEKGKVGGVLWMSVGDLVFESVPVLYQVLSTAPLGTLAPPATLAQQGLGYTAVIVPADSASARFVPELIKLKEREGLYAMHEGGLKASGGGTEVRVEGMFTLPAAVPPGAYTADLIAFRDQRPYCLGTTRIVVERVGTVGAMWSLAMDHRLFYGGTAVGVALVAGLLTGLLFRSKRHGSH